jgi:hypothetical protein
MLTNQSHPKLVKKDWSSFISFCRDYGDVNLTRCSVVGETSSVPLATIVEILRIQYFPFSEETSFSSLPLYRGRLWDPSTLLSNEDRGFFLRG